MKKEIADKWVEALRSGDYKQGQSYLKIGEDKFCCLGVLCDISKLGEWAGNVYKCNSRRDSAGYILSDKIIEWADINEKGVGPDNPGLTYTRLGSANDGGKSFLEIADMIEKSWEEL